MSEDDLIRNCAPTLAGIKTASLFTCVCQDRTTLLNSVRQLNNRLVAKGLRLLPLRFSDQKALLYLYRPAKLRRDLTHSTAERLLNQQGYPTENCEKCVLQLARKLRCQKDFPHEIGLFLGYPPEDVCGFMEQGPNLCKCTGCWKVYTDVEAAQKTFAQYKKCTRIYRDRRSRGANIDRLTVSS